MGTRLLQELDRACEDIPMPIVTLNRWILVVGTSVGALLGQPLLITLLFLLLLPTAFFGQRASLIYYVGQRLFAKIIPIAEREDRRVQRFNNTIATLLLCAAQIAFIFGAPLVGWALTLTVTAAAGLALAGFCVGCFMYYQLRLNRYRLFGK